MPPNMNKPFHQQKPSSITSSTHPSIPLHSSTHPSIPLHSFTYPQLPSIKSQPFPRSFSMPQQLNQLAKAAKLRASNSCEAVTLATIIAAFSSFSCLFVSVATNGWLHSKERILAPNNSFVYMDIYSGLWRKCVSDPLKDDGNLTCTHINYFTPQEKEGLGPTDSIILALRKVTCFPLIGLLLMTVALKVTLASLCSPYKQCLTVAFGFLFVSGGLFTLVGIVTYISAITEEASNKAKGKDDLPFRYYYGPSLILALLSFLISQVAGVVSIRLFLSRRVTKSGKEGPIRMKDITMTSLVHPPSITLPVSISFLSNLKLHEKNEKIGERTEKKEVHEDEKDDDDDDVDSHPVSQNYFNQPSHLSFFHPPSPLRPSPPVSPLFLHFTPPPHHSHHHHHHLYLPLRNFPHHSLSYRHHHSPPTLLHHHPYRHHRHVLQTQRSVGHPQLHLNDKLMPEDEMEKKPRKAFHHFRSYSDCKSEPQLVAPRPHKPRHKPRLLKACNSEETPLTSLKSSSNRLQKNFSQEWCDESAREVDGGSFRRGVKGLDEGERSFFEGRMAFDKSARSLGEALKGFDERGRSFDGSGKSFEESGKDFYDDGKGFGGSGRSFGVRGNRVSTLHPTKSFKSRSFNHDALSRDATNSRKKSCLKVDSTMKSLSFNDTSEQHKDFSDNSFNYDSLLNNNINNTNSHKNDKEKKGLTRARKAEILKQMSSMTLADEVKLGHQLSNEKLGHMPRKITPV